MGEGRDLQWSLITVTYNSEQRLRHYWNEFRPSAQVEWIVVDNGSADATISVAEELGARVVRQAKNLGFAAANNVGFRVATGKLVAFVNPDVRVDVASLAQLEAVLQEEDLLIAPQLLNDDGSTQPNGRGYPSVRRQILNRIRPNRADSSYLRAAPASDTPLRVDWVTGAVVMGRFETFNELGPWNDAFFLYYEDVDLCVRAKAAGRESAIVGSVQWVHGWARESQGWRVRPWARQLSAAMRFYAMYPRFIWTRSAKQGSEGTE